MNGQQNFDIYNIDTETGLPANGMLVIGEIPIDVPKTCNCCGHAHYSTARVSIATEWGLWFNCACGSTLIAPSEEFSLAKMGI